jgi:roadblock/LC7 domain-containing protein
MLKRLLAVDGVMAVCQFRDDGQLVEAHGVMDEAVYEHLAKFAHDYKRMVQGNADQLAMFTQMRGWTPPGGWMVRGPKWSVCAVANVVCVFDHSAGSVNEVMKELQQAAHW